MPKLGIEVWPSAMISNVGGTDTITPNKKSELLSQFAFKVISAAMIPSGYRAVTIHTAPGTNCPAVLLP